MPRPFVVALLIGSTLLAGCASSPQMGSVKRDTSAGAHPDFWEGTDAIADAPAAESTGWWSEHPFVKYACITLGVSALLLVGAAFLTVGAIEWSGIH